MQDRTLIARLTLHRRWFANLVEQRFLISRYDLPSGVARKTSEPSEENRYISSEPSGDPSSFEAPEGTAENRPDSPVVGSYVDSA